MPQKMTSRERIGRMFEHREADRIPVMDIPWSSTIERWRREGMPENVGWAEYFDLDYIPDIRVDNSPRFETRIIEDTDEYTIQATAWGVILKSWKHAASTPQFLDFTIVDPQSWAAARDRIRPSTDRIDWKYLEKNYKTWKAGGAWIQASLWFGFDVTHSWIVGTERLLCALVENPDWCKDMFSYLLEVNLALLDKVWEAGYHFDGVCWPDDMGYKQHQFFSLELYRELLKPYHKRAIEWAHRKGIRAELHSCGDINPFVPELIGIGLDALNPLEVKAGMDPIVLKEKYGNRLVLRGGVNAVLWNDMAAVKTEIERLVPALKKSGGYIFSSDHSVPNCVSLKDFKQIVELAKSLGTY